MPMIILSSKSAQNGNLRAMKYLVAHGANIHVNSEMALYLSAKIGSSLKM